MAPRTRLANAAIALHFAVLALWLGGIVIAFLLPAWRPYQAVYLIIVQVAQWLFEGCPITMLESSFRGGTRDGTIARGGFIVGYVNRWFGLTLSNDSARKVITPLTLLGAALGCVWLVLALL